MLQTSHLSLLRKQADWKKNFNIENMLKNNMKGKMSSIASETRKEYSVAWAGQMIWKGID